jgi:UDP-perosamine 4-acetyltransferase
LRVPGAERVVMIGAGGHARVCLEALRESGHDVVAAVSRDGKAVAGLEVAYCGLEADLAEVVERLAARAGFVAIGSNADRAAAADRWAQLTRLPLATAVSEHAVVSRSVELGEGTALLPGAVVNAATVLGRGVIVNTNASVDHDNRIGDFSHVAPGVAIGGGVTIGARALIGLGARVIPGITIGDDAVVGAGAVVVRDVAPGVVVVGNPARPLVRK